MIDQWLTRILELVNSAQVNLVTLADQYLGGLTDWSSSTLTKGLDSIKSM